MENTQRNLRRLTRAQKEAKIIELHESGYSVAEITKMIGCSATTATDVINRYKKTIEPIEKSKRSRALALYQNGADILNVAIELDMPVSESEEYNREYLYAKGIDDLYELRSKMGQSFDSFMVLCKEMESRNMMPSEIDEGRIIILKLTDLRKELDHVQAEKKSRIEELLKIPNLIGKHIMIDELVKDKINKILDNHSEFLLIVLHALLNVLNKDVKGEFRNLVFPPYETHYDDFRNKFLKLVSEIANQIEPEMQKEVLNSLIESIKIGKESPTSNQSLQSRSDEIFPRNDLSN